MSRVTLAEVCFGIVGVHDENQIPISLQFVVIESQLVLELGLEVAKEPSSEECRMIASDVRHAVRQLQLEQVFGRAVEIAVFVSRANA